MSLYFSISLFLFHCYCKLFQIQISLAKDVQRKVKTNLEHHEQYADNLKKATAWIDNAKEVMRQCSETTPNCSRQVLQSRLDQIQVNNFPSLIQTSKLSNCNQLPFWTCDRIRNQVLK